MLCQNVYSSLYIYIINCIAKYSIVIYNIDLLEDLFFLVRCIKISLSNSAFIYIKHMELSFFKSNVSCTFGVTPQTVWKKLSIV